MTEENNPPEEIINITTICNFYLIFKHISRDKISFGFITKPV